MTSKSKNNPAPPAAQIYLVTAPVGDVDATIRALEAALAAAPVAAVLLRLADSSENSLVTTAKRIAPYVQNAGAALVLDDRPDIVGKAGADGAHLHGIEALKDAAGGLKPQRIAGVGGVTTRHDAMLAAETGADYVMFGEHSAEGRRPDFQAVLERVSWWTEVFEVPCVGFATSIEEAAALARAGAEFVALDAPLWTGDDGADTIARITESLTFAEPA